MDETHAQRGRQWLIELLRLMGLDAVVELNPAPPFGEDSDWLTISDTYLTSEQIQLLLGTGGEVLDSIQYLANATLNLGLQPDQQGAYTIELAGYRVQRYEELKALAEQAAEQVRQTGAEYELKSLSSAERRQVHTLLKAYEDLETSSRGQEPNRRLVIRRVSEEEA